MDDNKKKDGRTSLNADTMRILAQGVEVSNDTFATRCNNNDLIIGSTGSGKTRHYVKPNILSASESLVITDPNGETNYSHFFITFFSKKGDAING